MLLNQLQQLKKVTKIVADTGDINQIKKFSPEDATTNPSLILKASQMEEYNYIFQKSLKETSKKNYLSNDDKVQDILMHISVLFGVEISKVIKGLVSTEVDARLSYDTESTIVYAKKIISLYEKFGINKDRVLIKIASTWEGIKAAEILEKNGIRCNLTLMFSLVQAVSCAEANVFLVSPFVGRITDWYKSYHNLTSYPEIEKDEGIISVKNIYEYYKTFNYKTIIMGASFRSVKQVKALSGCDALTISPNLLEELQNSNDLLETNLKPYINKDLVKLSYNKEKFLQEMSKNPMASEKLKQGIEGFIKDTIILEKNIKEKFKIK